jgi:hypothetical protein
MIVATDRHRPELLAQSEPGISYRAGGFFDGASAMARIRSIKPEFWSSEQIVECSTTARLLFIGLWSFSDDAGNHPASIKRIKMEIFPADDFDDTQIAGWIEELISSHDEDGIGLICRYSANDKMYFHVTGWHHQRIDKPTYRFPPHNGGTNSPRPPRAINEPSPPESSRVESSRVDGSGVESSGVESSGNEEDSTTSTTTSFWDSVKTRAQAVSRFLIQAKRWRRTRDMKSLVLHACGLIEMGEMPEAWLDDAVEAVVTAEKVDNPTGFLADRLTKFAASAGKDFSVMRRALKIPEELLDRKPTPGPEDES